MSEGSQNIPEGDALIQLQENLLGWFAVAKRSMPWREKRTVYRTVISEFMLQQTQVKTVLPYFEQWVKSFPDFAALAAATEADVLKHWEGLGYYSRARNLHRLAKAVVQADTPPASAAEWRKLPGVGPYASAAIASIAQGEPIAVVDGNVVRVLARLIGDTTEFRNSTAAVAHIRPIAEHLLNAKKPGEHNEALMELGATVCLRRRPLCTVCPWVNRCRAAAMGRTGEIPLIRRKAIIRKTVERVWILQSGKLLLHRIPDNAQRLAGQYELPARESLGDVATIAVETTPLLQSTRGIANERILEPIYAATLPEEAALPSEYQWVPLADLDKHTLVGPHRKWIRQIRDETSKREPKR